MGRLTSWSFIAIILGLLLAAACQTAAAAEAPRMTIDALNAMPEDMDFTVLDVRIDKSWEISDRKAEGAIREDPDEVEVWAHKYPKDKPLVLYCS
jgi:hypothetical protein